MSFIHIFCIFRAHKVPATFYITGSKIGQYKAVIGTMMGDGHQLGTHTVTHQMLDKIDDPQDVKDEVYGAIELLQVVTGHRCRNTYSAICKQILKRKSVLEP